MAQIKLIKNRIKAAKNIAQITRTIQMVAASKMQRSQRQAEASRAYADRFYDIFRYLAGRYHRKNDNRAKGQPLVILIGPDRGLCGGLMTGLTRYLLNNYKGIQLDEVRFVAVGRKAKDAVLRLHGDLVAEFSGAGGTYSPQLAGSLVKLIYQEWRRGNASEIIAFYSHFINTMTQQPNSRRLLPIEMPEGGSTGDFVFEPSAKAIFRGLLRRYLETEIYQLLLEAFASEQSARMVAMKNATDNAGEIVNGLTLEFNRLRQQAITNEINDLATAGMAVGS